MFIIHDGQKLDVTAQDLADMARAGKINADTDVSFKGAFHKAGEFKELKKIFDEKKEVSVPVPLPLETKSKDAVSTKSVASTNSSNKIILFAVVPLALMVVLLLGVLIGRSSHSKDPATSTQEVIPETATVSAQDEQEEKSKLDEDTQAALDISVRIIKDRLKNPYSAKFHPKHCEKSVIGEIKWFCIKIDVEATNETGGFLCKPWYVFLRKDVKKTKEWERPWDCPCVRVNLLEEYWIEHSFSQTDDSLYVKDLEGYISPLHDYWKLLKELESGQDYEHISLEEDQ